jgi:hypothetical protein
MIPQVACCVPFGKDPFAVMLAGQRSCSHVSHRRVADDTVCAVCPICQGTCSATLLKVLLVGLVWVLPGGVSGVGITALYPLAGITFCAGPVTMWCSRFLRASAPLAVPLAMLVLCNVQWTGEHIMFRHEGLRSKWVLRYCILKCEQVVLLDVWQGRALWYSQTLSLHAAARPPCICILHSCW